MRKSWNTVHENMGIIVIISNISVWVVIPHPCAINSIEVKIQWQTAELIILCAYQKVALVVINPAHFRFCINTSQKIPVQQSLFSVFFS